MQALARKIDAHRRLVALRVHVHAQVGTQRVHARPLPRALAKLVDDGVLHALSSVEAVLQILLAASQGHIDGQRALHRQVGAPVDGQRAGVQVIRVCGGKIGQRQQDTVSDPRPQTGAVRQLERPLEGNPSAGFGYAARPQPAQLVGKQPLHPLGGSGK